MALVRKLVPLKLDRPSLQKEAEAKYATYSIDGKGFVQINTYGSVDREIPGKVSQVLQFDRDSAEQLIAIFRKTFQL